MGNTLCGTAAARTEARAARVARRAARRDARRARRAARREARLKARAAKAAALAARKAKAGGGDGDGADGNGGEAGRPSSPGGSESASVRALSEDASYYDAGADGFEVDDELDWSDDGSEEPPELALATHKRDRSLFGEFVRSFSDRRLPDDDTDSGPENEGQGARPVRVPVRNRPMVGATLRHIGTIGASANEECWEEPDTTTFMVRGANYIKDKVKVKSVPAIYAAVAADAFTSPQRLDHVMRRLRLPSPNIALGGPLLPPPGSPAAQLEGHLPRFLVINIQVPSYEPKLFGSPGNGSGINIVLVHELVANGSRIAPQARALVERFFRNEADPVTGEPTRERLKYIPRICNCEQVCVEAGLSRAEKTFMQTYDGKPVMTRPQHRFFRGPDEPGSGRDYLEIDIDAHAYSFVARRGVHAYRHLLDRMIMDSGFVLQGNVGEELPEQVLCACRVHHLDFHKERPPPDLGLLSQASQLSPGRRGVQEAGAVPPPEPASPAAGGGVARVLAAPAE